MKKLLNLFRRHRKDDDKLIYECIGVVYDVDKTGVELEFKSDEGARVIHCIPLRMIKANKLRIGDIVTVTYRRR